MKEVLGDLMARVRRQHPIRAKADGSLLASSGAPHEVPWRRLDAMAPEGRREALAALTRVERAILLHSRAEWRHLDWAPDAVRYHVQRGERRWLPFAAELHIMTNGGFGVADLMAQLTDVTFLPPILRPVVTRARPLDDLVRGYLAQHESMQKYLRDLRSGIWAEVADDVLRLLLKSARVPTQVIIEREGENRIGERVRALLPTEFGRWFARYLNETSLEGRRNEDVLLRWILAAFGTPHDGKPFWNHVSDVKQRQFQRWTIGRELEDFLGSGPRLEFWKQFLPLMTHLKVNRDHEVVLLHFPGVTAVQFRTPGTATRLVSAADGKDLHSYYWEEIRYTVLNLQELGYYRHSAGTGWQIGAAEEVRRTLRLYSRA